MRISKETALFLGNPTSSLSEPSPRVAKHTQPRVGGSQRGQFPAPSKATKATKALFDRGQIEKSNIEHVIAFNEEHGPFGDPTRV